MTKTLDELQKLITRYTEACDDLGAGLFEQTESETTDKHAAATALWNELTAALRELIADAERYRWLLQTFGDSKHGLPQLDAAWDDDGDWWRPITFWGTNTPEKISAAIDAQRTKASE